jgi:hypothetical protein
MDLGRLLFIGWLAGYMIFNTTFSNISAISWQSVLLEEETGVHGENHRLAENVVKIFK